VNGQLVNDYQSTHQQSGYIALQAHDFLSRTQFRNLQIKKLP
jgi:3-keto-disaccharide hydrolase